MTNEENNLIQRWNDYCDEVSASDQIYFNDDDAFELLGITIKQILIAQKMNRYDWDDKYLALDGYANPVSFNKLEEHIDIEELTNYEQNK
jgi:hypothetical protein